jgi:Suppressor of fused protein (SUFU)
MDDTPPLVRHIESQLGLIDPKVGHWGWNHADGTRLQVVAFRNKPVSGATTLCTLGLSRHELCSPQGHVRQELVMSCWDRFVSARLAGLFPVAAEHALETHTALQPWHILGPSGPLLPDISLQALLCREPLGFPSSFAVCEETQPPTEFVWLIPISAEEAAEVKTGQRREVLTRWQEEEFDILDWGRGSFHKR